MPKAASKKGENSTLSLPSPISQQTRIPAAQPVSADVNPGPCSLSDSSVDIILKITNAFQVTFSACTDRIVEAIERKLNNRLDTQEVQVFDCNKRIDKLEKTCADLTKENEELRSTIKLLTNKLSEISTNCDDLDQYSRNSNLLIHGLPISQTSSETPSIIEGNVLHVLNSNLGLALTPSDVNAVHRLPRQQPQSSTSHAKPPPIIVQFTSRKVRNAVLQNRRNLKGKGFSITEQLTAKKSALLRQATDYVTSGQIKGCWSQEGKIIVKTRNDRTTVVTSVEDIQKL
jgi:hypothetical protein